MKITKWVDVGQEIEIEIGLTEIRDAMAEAFANVTDTPLFKEDAPNQNDVVRALNFLGKFLLAMTDQQIALLNDAQRNVIGKHLGKQAERFLIVERATHEH